jgi:hypothetical protein
VRSSPLETAVTGSQIAIDALAPEDGRLFGRFETPISYAISIRNDRFSDMIVAVTKPLLKEKRA